MSCYNSLPVNVESVSAELSQNKMATLMTKPEQKIPILPVAPLKNTHDTRNVYNVENVSYGAVMGVDLSDGRHIGFKGNKLTTDTRLDERNLCFCLYLNLFNSSITEL